MRVSRRVRLAIGLWIVWAIVVWNVIFDRMLVVAARQYVHAAALAAQNSRPYLLIKDWMGPAITRAEWTATAAGSALLAIGAVLIALAARRESSKAQRTV